MREGEEIYYKYIIPPLFSVISPRLSLFSASVGLASALEGAETVTWPSQFPPVPGSRPLLLDPVLPFRLHATRSHLEIRLPRGS